LRLGAHVRAAALGRVYAEAGFKLASDPDTVRGPDIAFISRGRLPDPEPAGFPDLAPDLVVEVLSPGDRPGEVLAKVADWLSAGRRTAPLFATTLMTPAVPCALRFAGVPLPPWRRAEHTMGMPQATHYWTPDDVRALPDDGRRYEVVAGELLVTPAPSFAHQ